MSRTPAGSPPPTPAPGVVVRDYAPADWPALCRVHDAARMQELAASVGVAAFLTLEQTAEGEGLFDDRVWVAVSRERVVGFVAFAEDEVTWLYVDPAHQRRGVGRALLRHALAHAGPVVEASVLAGNDAALALYTAEGFALRETRSGSLVGNESFPATGHILEYRRP